MNSIVEIWSKIKQYEGKIFFTRTKKEFTYEIVSNGLKPIRNGQEINRILPKKHFEKMLEHMPLKGKGPGIFSNTVQGSAYVYGILTDERIVE